MKWWVCRVDLWGGLIKLFACSSEIEAMEQVEYATKEFGLRYVVLEDFA